MQDKIIEESLRRAKEKLEKKPKGRRKTKKSQIVVQGIDQDINFSNNNDDDVQPITEKSDIAEALQSLMEDKMDASSRMSGIDMRSILHDNEISGILAIDTLVSFGFLPIECSKFTRIKKRLNVSKKGTGREQIVKMISGEREQQRESGLKGLMNRFKPGGA